MDTAQPAPCIHPADAERFYTEGSSVWPPDPQPELRRPCCGTLRRASHTPECIKAHANCPGCTGMDPAHLASCPKSVLVDVPGEAQPVLASDLPTILRGREYCAGEMPATLKSELDREERDRLLICVLFAAKRLVDGRRHDNLCLDCGRSWTAHTRFCSTKGVLDALDALKQLPGVGLTPLGAVASVPDATGDSTASARSGLAQHDWVIQRCTLGLVDCEFQYEDFPTPEGRMTREQMVAVLQRVAEENPLEEFRGQRVASSTGGAR